MEYRKAGEVRTVALELISRRHEHLMRFPARYVFHKELKWKKGRPVWYTVSTKTGLEAMLLLDCLSEHEMMDTAGEVLILFDVCEETWNRFNETEREALVDEMLCSCVIDSEKESEPLMIVKPDVQAYKYNVVKYGDWHKQLSKVADLIKNGGQLALVPDGEDSDGA